MPRDIYDEGEEHGWVTPRGALHDHIREVDPPRGPVGQTPGYADTVFIIPWERCETCGGLGYHGNSNSIRWCGECDGIGYLDVPTDEYWCWRLRPGSEAMCVVLRARSRVGAYPIQPLTRGSGARIDQ